MSNSTPTNATLSDAIAAGSGCCGGPAPDGAGACCARDAEVKATGGTGCGCSSAPATTPKAARSGCCG
jgi:hypothetical protein